MGRVGGKPCGKSTADSDKCEKKTEACGEVEVGEMEEGVQRKKEPEGGRDGGGAQCYADQQSYRRELRGF